MVNKENMRKWVDALRSGKYQQATGTLRLENQFCCLGVACEISGIGRWDSDIFPGSLIYVTPAGSHSGILPMAVGEWLGFDPDQHYTDENGLHPRVTLDDKAAFISNQRSGLDPDEPGACKAGGDQFLAALNDSKRLSFEDIADLIEATYL